MKRTLSIFSVTIKLMLTLLFAGGGYIYPFQIINSARAVDTAKINVNEGWNIISLPLIVPDGRVSTLFPTATSSAFKYDDAYIEEDTLLPGIGYWLKFSQPENISVTGTTMPIFSVDMKQGWNLVGSVNAKIPSKELVTQPCGIISSDYFSFSTGYDITDTLEPGKGYWVKVSEAGNLLEKKWKKIAGGYNAHLTIHPTEPNILYESVGWDYETIGVIMKSTDWGLKWDTLVKDIGPSFLAIDETNPNIIYAVGGSIYLIQKTTDGGNTWFPSDQGIDISASVIDLQLDPNNNNILYSKTYEMDFGYHLWKTTNGGNSWFPLVNYHSINCATDTICWFLRDGVDLAIDPHNSNVLYGVSVNTLFQSIDAGSNWNIIHRFPDSTLGYMDTSLSSPYINFIRSFYVDLHDSNTLYISAKGFFKSTDQGQSWQKLTSGLPDPIFARIHLSKNPNSIYLSTSSGGIYHSADGGVNWQTVINEIPDPSCFQNFQDIDETGLLIYMTKEDTSIYHPTEIDGLYRLNICK